MIYAGFESILVPEDNGKQNPKESYMNKYQKHIACSYGYKLAYVEDTFSKPIKTNSGKNSVYNFINNMTGESKYCTDLMKKCFKKELVMNKEGNEEFKNSIKCWICDNDYDDNDIKVRNHSHITRKFRSSVHRDCNISFKLNQKIFVAFHNLKTMISILLCKT